MTDTAHHRPPGESPGLGRPDLAAWVGVTAAAARTSHEAGLLEE